MTDWKDDLIKKAEQLHIEGGEDGGQEKTERISGDRVDNLRSNSSRGISQNASNSDNSPCSGSGSLLRRGISEESRIKTNTKGGTNTMITIEGALSDIEKIEKDATISSDVKVLRAFKVLLKFLSTMRSNQLLTDVEKTAIQVAQKNREKKPEGK